MVRDDGLLNLGLGTPSRLSMRRPVIVCCAREELGSVGAQVTEALTATGYQVVPEPCIVDSGERLIPTLQKASASNATLVLLVTRHLVLSVWPKRELNEAIGQFSGEALIALGCGIAPHDVRRHSPLLASRMMRLQFDENSSMARTDCGGSVLLRICDGHSDSPGSAQ